MLNIPCKFPENQGYGKAAGAAMPYFLRKDRQSVH